MIDRITENTIVNAVEELAKLDSDFARIYREIGPPPLRSRPQGFASLFGIICAQQVSTASAAAIIKRLVSATSPLTPESYLKLTTNEIKSIGLSRQKALYGQTIAEAVLSGALNFGAISRMPDDDAIQTLTALKGIGPWTAEVYLLFALGRTDLWPVGDLAVVKGLLRLKGITERPPRKILLEIAEPWRPFRSVAARMLWHYLRMNPTGG